MLLAVKHVHHNFFGISVSVVEVETDAEMPWNSRPISMHRLNLHIVAGPWRDMGQNIAVPVSRQTEDPVSCQDQKDFRVDLR